MRRTFTRTTVRLGAIAERVARRQLVLQIAFGILAFVLGLWGWTIKSPPADLNGWTNNFFRTVQLITLHFPTEFDGALPWQLQVGRLAVPLVAFAASLNVVLGAITRPVRLALLPLVSDQVIFFGTPKLTDAAMARLIEDGHHLVFVHSDIHGERLDVLEGLGVTVAAADALSTQILGDLNLPAARAIFISTGDDVANANLAIMIAERIGARSADRDRLVLAVEFDREDLAAELIRVVDETGRAASIRFVRLSPDREGLTLELRTHAPVFASGRGRESAHALVVGLKGSWEQTLSRLIVALQDRPDQSPLITLILDASERLAFERWRDNRPNLSLVARFSIRQRGSDLLPELHWDRPPSSVPPHLVIILREDTEGLATALAARRVDGIPKSVPILVRQSREDRLLAHLSAQGRRDGRSWGPIRPFGGLLRGETIRRLLDRAGDGPAIALHAAYLGRAEAFGVDNSRVLETWEALPETFREANRSAAAHAPVLLAALGRAPEGPGGDALAGLSEEDWLRLAQIEHRRWCADRIDRGWQSGPVRDDAERIHPCLVDWEALPDVDRHKDMGAVRTLLEIGC
jgi:hypothetical protein